MAEKSLTWNGPAVIEKMRQAQIKGVNVTMGRSVLHAYNNHPWQNQTGELEGSLDVHQPAKEVSDGVEGKWGSADINYALTMELGATIEPKNAKALAIPQPDGSVRFAKRVVIPPHPFLRPAADAQYPGLPDAIRKAYEGSAKGDET